ncbi:MAG: SCO family protein [Bacteroidota bacterium]
MNCQTKAPTATLPIIGEKKIVNGDTVYHHIAGFKLINQAGDTISNNTVKGKIYVANFFFATCQSICPKMSNHLVWVQKQFKQVDSVLILSHSVNPKHDTVAVLANYAGSFGAIKNKWHLLTGDKKLIYDLAKTSYLVNALEDDGSAEGFLHSNLFLLIDYNGRIRGTYDGTDSLSVVQLVKDVQILRTQ